VPGDPLRGSAAPDGDLRERRGRHDRRFPQLTALRRSPLIAFSAKCGEVRGLHHGYLHRKAYLCRDKM
jgi:hypothetical protein